MRTDPRTDHGRTRARLMAVVTTIVVLWFLRWSAPATVPLAFAVFVAMLLVPLMRLLERWLPRSVAVLGSFLALVAVLVAFGATVVWTADRLAAGSEGYVERITAAADDARGWLDGHGLSVPEGGAGLLPGGSVSAAAQRAGRQIVSTGSGVLLVVALAVLALLEVDRLGGQLRAALPRERADRIKGLVDSMAGQFQRYLVARTALGLLNGAVATVLAWIIGLDFALVWGILTFTLNYIPTIGSVVAVLPPTLFALVQFDGFTMPAVVLAAMVGSQLVLGNYVDPLVEGKYLSIPPFHVLFAVVFWGWLWGIPGAFLGVPITVAIVIVTDHFDATRWIARLLGAGGSGEQPDRGATAA